MFTTVENFWAERDFEIPKLDTGESYEKIRQQILLLNPMAEEKTIRKFIKGETYEEIDFSPSGGDAAHCLRTE